MSNSLDNAKEEQNTSNNQEEKANKSSDSDE